MTASSAATPGAVPAPATGRRGLILAGGAGTRLHPLTRVVSKQLLPVYDKPMIYYPLSTLMLAGIRTILVITTPQDAPLFQALLGDGRSWGLDLHYAVQPEPKGLAQAYTLGRAFVDGRPSCLVLGDNLFYGHGLTALLRAATARAGGATVFASWVREPERYGVAELDATGRLVRILEKPARPPSHWAVTGLYLYDGHAPELAAGLRPSARGELEITDLNNAYLAQGRLELERLGRGVAWLDTGTPETLLAAGEFIRTIEERQGLKVGCPEEIAFGNGWIGPAELLRLADAYGRTAYGDYLRGLLDGDGPR